MPSQTASKKVITQIIFAYCPRMGDGGLKKISGFRVFLHDISINFGGGLEKLLGAKFSGGWGGQIVPTTKGGWSCLVTSKESLQEQAVC